MMNRDELKNVISVYRQALSDDKKIEVNAMLVDQNNQRKLSTWMIMQRHR